MTHDHVLNILSAQSSVPAYPVVDSLIAASLESEEIAHIIQIMLSELFAFQQMDSRRWADGDLKKNIGCSSNSWLKSSPVVSICQWMTPHICWTQLAPVGTLHCSDRTAKIKSLEGKSLKTLYVFTDIHFWRLFANILEEEKDLPSHQGKAKEEPNYVIVHTYQTYHTYHTMYLYSSYPGPIG